LEPGTFSHEITQLLHDWRKGSDAARDRLMPLVYDQLRSLAARHMRGERSDHTLQATALVNEAFLRLVESEVDWHDRVHFFSLASRLIRHILVDYARRRLRARRGGDASRVTLTDALAVGQPCELLALHEALERLAANDARKVEVLELHLFGGLEQEEIAEALGISATTVYRELRFAKAFVRNQLGITERA
jgi:RNA polymerase sigma factor (TIGR02999 family)